MKIEELKHNHSLTDLLKILLFAILMLAPIGMVATRCLYVVCNKNAYQSYSGQDLDTYETLNTIDDVELNKNYHFSSIETYDNASNVQSGNVVYSNIENIYTSDIDIKTALQNGYYFIYYARIDQRQLYIYDNNNVLLANRSVYTQTLEFDFTLVAYTSNYFVNTLKSFTYKSQNNNSYMDNVFEYSVSKLEESNLFNWTENTAIYSGINAMNVQLGINSPAITIVLTYWLILTCIYVIIDIVLKLFTYITHMIGSRKA